MPRKTINIAQLKVQPHHLFYHQCPLLSSGDFSTGHFNTMTIGWGALGTMWSRPFAFVAVRHSRFTYEFIEQYDAFTLSILPAEYREAINLLGTQSGRDGDKIAKSGLTPEAAQVVAAPVFAEAEIVIECKNIYANDLDPAKIPADVLHKHYPNGDFHRIYYGEIVAVSAVDSYIA
ncbi:MAG: flavin reductase family protein [Anaerolineaceae bacterium]|jgi:flavin reductase (DIM6/NTAB) family NADH-FMN oxidoreductase RutF|nr:flavin reductase family protein [Anaerolineaceae bacterium]